MHPAWAMIGCFEKLVLEKWTIDQLYISQVGQCQVFLCRIKWFTLYKTKIIKWCWAILSTSLPRNALKPWKTHLWSVGFCCPFMGFPTMSRIDLGIKMAQIQRDRSNVGDFFPIPKKTTLPKFNIAPEKWWLEDSFLLGLYIFRGYVKLPGGNNTSHL